MISGERVGLRCVERGDLPKLRDWRNIPSFRRNFREYRELGLEDQNRWFDSLQSSRSSNFMFIIERLSDGEAIGACGLLYVNWIIRAADVSFYIGWNQAYVDNEGFAKDAAELLIKYGFETLNLNKLWMELYEFDTRKLDFFGQLGFKRDGRLRDNCFEDGRYWDSYIISLTAADRRIIG